MRIVMSGAFSSDMCSQRSLPFVIDSRDGAHFATMRRALLPFVVLLLMALLVPASAYADDYLPFVAGSKKQAVRMATTVTAKEKTAYNRAVKACMNYAKQPNPIVVDVSDLKLTRAQALHVGYMLHSNGELFWINTYDDNSFMPKKFTIPCTFSDSTITAMRKKLNAKVTKALKRITPSMDASTKVHALHDYLIDTVNYGSGNKTSYTGLVNGKGDCFGFTLSMDVLLRRAGFTTDVAYSNDGQHAWNQVKIGSKWYHVDVTWDNGYSGQYYWKKSRCHIYLLQSDAILKLDEHKGWWAHHKCTSTLYADDRLVGGVFDTGCNDYKLYTNGFTVNGLKYKACGNNKVALVAVSSKKQKKTKTLSVPATVKYKKVRYTVTGLASKCFAGAKAKTVKISSAKLTKSGVKGCLISSKVTRVKLTGSATKMRATYKKCFSKANCGKKVAIA